MTPITVGSMKLKVINLIGDSVKLDDIYSLPVSPIAGGQTSASILMDGITAALKAVSSRIWKPATFEIGGGVTSSDLPADLIDIEGVKDLTSGAFVPKIPLSIGGTFKNGWMLYPVNTITFLNTLETNGARIYYSAVWATPEEDLYTPIIDDVVLDIPAILAVPVSFYATGYCMLERASESAVLRQYNTKVDSGQPIDNPLKDMANEFFRLFDVEMKRYPQMQKGITS